MEWFFITTLLQIPKFGRKTVGKIIRSLPDLPTGDLTTMIIYDYLLEAFDQKMISKIPDENIIYQALEKAETIRKDMDFYNIKACSIQDENFPKQIARTSDSPLVLFYKGAFDILNHPGVAVIGTRNPTSHGDRIAQRFGEVFSQKQFTVISGLAVGCDTGGHKGCLGVGGKTCAIMAHGLDKVYPAENKTLAQQIVEEGGCLVSEYVPGTRSLPAYFVERDRIQSAASMGVLVVESDVNGGSMHAVKFAKQYNRLIGCYSHDQSFANNKQTYGNKKLIEERIAMSLRIPSEIEHFSQRMLNLWMEQGA